MTGAEFDALKADIAAFKLQRLLLLKRMKDMGFARAFARKWLAEEAEPGIPAVAAPQPAGDHVGSEFDLPAADQNPMPGFLKR